MKISSEVNWMSSALIFMQNSLCKLKFENFSNFFKFHFAINIVQPLTFKNLLGSIMT